MYVYICIYVYILTKDESKELCNEKFGNPRVGLTSSDCRSVAPPLSFK